MENIFRRVPEAMYYVDRFELTWRRGRCVLKPEYVNQSYPADLVARADGHSLEMILHAAVSRYVSKLVLVLPESVGFRWVLHCFMERSVSFYPNFSGCGTRTLRYPGVPYVVYELQLRYRIGTVMLQKMELEVAGEIDRLGATIFREDLPEGVRCLLAHNYLVHTVSYFNPETATPLARSALQSAYGALIERRCVCQGYAEAYKRLLDSFGVPCDLVIGQLHTKKDEWHAWNLVHLRQNTLHCHVDVTFDAGSPPGKRCRYFLRDDRFFSTDRSWNTFYYTPCQDGLALLEEARLYCARHREELLSRGLQPAWLGEGR